MMVICGWVQNRILAYLSGEMTGPQAGFIRQHIAGCKHCQKAIELLKRIQRAVAEALPASVKAPDTLSARIMAAVETIPPEPPHMERRE